MKEKDATYLVKSMIGCLSPDLFVPKNRHKNLMMTEGKGGMRKIKMEI